MARRPVEIRSERPRRGAVGLRLANVHTHTWSSCFIYVHPALSPPPFLPFPFSPVPPRSLYFLNVRRRTARIHRCHPRTTQQCHLVQPLHRPRLRCASFRFFRSLAHSSLIMIFVLVVYFFSLAFRHVPRRILHLNQDTSVRAHTLSFSNDPPRTHTSFLLFPFTPARPRTFTVPKGLFSIPQDTCSCLGSRRSSSYSPPPSSSSAPG